MRQLNKGINPGSDIVTLACPVGNRSMAAGADTAGDC
jgi:hypothetical protein